MTLLAAPEQPMRLDQYLAAELGETRSQIKLLIDAGLATVNGARVKAGYLLKGGEAVDVEGTVDRVPAAIQPENIPLSVVYEDESLAVIDKPQGMVVHPASGVYTGTLVNALLYHFDALSGVNGAVRPGIVHRLDKDTSGLLVVAKTNAAHVSLAAQIGAKTAYRAYLALSEGAIKENAFDLATAIGRDPRDRKRMAVLRDGEGKLALSHCDVLIRYAGYTLARWVLGTGRTHQIRVHAAYLRHPIVGDPVYGYAKQAFRLNGQLLHAYRLEFTHPVTGERMSFTTPVPAYFKTTLAKLTPVEILSAASETEKFIR